MKALISPQCRNISRVLRRRQVEEEGGVEVGAKIIKRGQMAFN